MDKRVIIKEKIESIGSKAISIIHCNVKLINGSLCYFDWNLGQNFEFIKKKHFKQS